jgi:chemotaxis protein methyltransferase CheR
VEPEIFPAETAICLGERSGQMDDTSCVAFLQWALPRLHLSWRGFRRVRRQVCRRIDRRIAALQLHSLASYAAYLEQKQEEWAVLDRLCRITISRFYRDRDVFDYLGKVVLPALVHSSLVGEKIIRVWSAGCASGEEPYTVAILWHYSLRPSLPCPRLEITATDIDPVLIDRAREACYPASSLRDLPPPLTVQAFERKNGLHCLRATVRNYVRFALMDIREQVPEEAVHLLFCRNLAFTYFDAPLRQHICRTFRDKIALGGALIIGKHETIPPEITGFAPWEGRLPIYRKI